MLPMNPLWFFQFYMLTTLDVMTAMISSCLDPLWWQLTWLCRDNVNMIHPHLPSVTCSATLHCFVSCLRVFAGVSCPSLSSNTALYTLSTTVSTYPIIVQVTCNTGYALDPMRWSNNTLRTQCQATGQWTTPSITCQRQSVSNSFVDNFAARYLCELLWSIVAVVVIPQAIL